MRCKRGCKARVVIVETLCWGVLRGFVLTLSLQLRGPYIVRFTRRRTFGGLAEVQPLRVSDKFVLKCLLGKLPLQPPRLDQYSLSYSDSCI